VCASMTWSPGCSVLSCKLLYSHSCTLTNVFEFTTQTCMCGQHRCKNLGINGCVLVEIYKSLTKNY
jgi:hypothetical protein